MGERRRAESWTNAEELLAGLTELVSLLRVEFLASKGVTDTPEPIRIRRPGQEDVPTAARKGPRRMSTSEFIRSGGQP